MSHHIVFGSPEAEPYRQTEAVAERKAERRCGNLMAGCEHREGLHREGIGCIKDVASTTCRCLVFTPREEDDECEVHGANCPDAV